MDFLSSMEDRVIDLDGLVSSFKFLSDFFENKMHEDYSYLVKSDKELYYELKSFNLLFSLLCKAFETLHTNCQNELDLYYKEL